MDGKEQFILELYPAASKVSRETGMAWQAILAQAAQETGWGQHQLSGTHNIFNIKADNSWHGPSETFEVWEIESGHKIWRSQSFRVYGSYEEALQDRIEFLRSNPRYTKAGLFDEGTKGSLEKEAAALQRAGYATDPHYSESLMRVFRSATMQRAVKEAQSKETASHNVSDAPTPSLDRQHQQLFVQQGTHGTAVSTLQANLAHLGYTDHCGQLLAADGIFGIDTRHAVERFQHDHHLTVDGKIGPQTQHALQVALQERAVTSSLEDARHPDHALFEQVLAGVRALDARHGRPTDPRSLNLAAALTAEAKREGLTRIDHVALDNDGNRIFSAQNPISHWDLLRYASVDTITAMRTPVAQSTELAEATKSPPVPSTSADASPTSRTHAISL